MNTVHASGGPHRAPLREGRRVRKEHALREQIYAAAWSLFDAGNYEAVTMDSIAAAADVARGTLYKYFATKEAFIQERFYRDAVERRDSSLAHCHRRRSTATRLRELLRLDGEYAECMRVYVGPYLQHRLATVGSNKAAVERTVFEEIVRGLLEQGCIDGEIRTHPSVAALTEHFVFLRIGTLMRWLDSGDVSIIPYFEQMLDLFLHGVARMGWNAQE